MQSRLPSLPTKRSRRLTSNTAFQMTRLPMVLIGAATAVFATSPRPAAAQRAEDDSVIVSTAWLARHLSDPKLVLLYVGHDTADAKAEHIPGSRFVSYMDITAQRDGLGTELPPVDQLKALFESVGVSSGSRVVIYGHQAPMASRAFFTLDYLGNVHASVLDGGTCQVEARGTPADDRGRESCEGFVCSKAASGRRRRRRVDSAAPWEAGNRADRYAYRRRIPRRR